MPMRPTPAGLEGRIAMPWKSSDPEFGDEARRVVLLADRRAARHQQHVGLGRLRAPCGCARAGRAGSRTAARRRRRARPARAAPPSCSRRCSVRSARCRPAAARRRSRSSATRGRRTQRALATPIDASSPASCGRSRRPARSTTSPAFTSSPIAPTCLRGATASRTSTRPSRSLATSAITTASAPSGSGAPVMMRTAWPARDASCEGAPRQRDADHLERDRVVVRRAEAVFAAQRIAVHRRAREGRNRRDARARRRPARVPRTSASGTSSASSARVFAARKRSTSSTSARSAKPRIRTSRGGRSRAIPSELQRRLRRAARRRRRPASTRGGRARAARAAARRPSRSRGRRSRRSSADRGRGFDPGALARVGDVGVEHQHRAVLRRDDATRRRRAAGRRRQRSGLACRPGTTRRSPRTRPAGAGGASLGSSACSACTISSHAGAAPLTPDTSASASPEKLPTHTPTV